MTSNVIFLILLILTGAVFMHQLTRAISETFERKKYYTVTFFTKVDGDDGRKNVRTFKIQQKQIYSFLESQGVKDFIDPTRLRQTEGRRKQVKDVDFTPGSCITLNTGGTAYLNKEHIKQTFNFVSVR